MKRFLINLTVFIAIVMGVIIAVQFLTQTPVQVAGKQQGTADLMDYDLETSIVAVHYHNYLYYPEALYDPGDFASGSVPEGTEAAQENMAQRNKTDYGTYRTVLSLPAGVTYGFSMRAMDYAQTLFINGVEQPAVGQVGSDKESTIPSAGTFQYVYTTESDETEIIIQHANFHHKEGGGPYPLYISTYRNIEQGTGRNLIRTSIIIGCMVTIFIFYLGMYLFFDRKTYFIYFALCSLSIGVRTSLIGDKLLMALIPDMGWETAMALEYLALILMSYFFLMLVNALFDGLFHRYALWFPLAVAVVYGGIVVFTKPVVYSGLLVYYHIAQVLLALYLVFRLVRSIRSSRPEHVMLYTGALFFLASVVTEIYTHQSYVFGALGISQLGMVGFIFTNMIAIAMQFSRTETELYQAEQKKAELEKLNKLKNDFLADISHEMKTPLTVMSGFAQLSAKELKHQGIPHGVEQNLAMITAEAQRLAQLVTQLLQVTSIRETLTEKTDTDVGRLVGEIAGLYAPVMQKKNNTVKVSVDHGPYILPVKPDMITQVILNLLTNANRYTKNGLITIHIEETDGQVLVSIADTGTGIDPKLLPEVFERFRKDGEETTGLGLSICREIIEVHGGRIWAENRESGGAAVFFTLPWKEIQT